MPLFRRPADAEETPAPAAAAEDRGGAAARVTLIGERTRVSGRIDTDEDLFVRGSFDGTIAAGSAVVVHPGGKVEAGVEAGQMAVHGRVQGDISAEGLVELGETASLDGNIRAPAVKVSSGAEFRGEIRRAPGGRPARAAAPGAGTAGGGAAGASAGKTGRPAAPAPAAKSAAR